MEGEGQSINDDDFITEALIAADHVGHTINIDKEAKKKKEEKKKQKKK